MLNRFKYIFSKLNVRHRVLLSALLVTLLATGITGTLAWNSGRQSALNQGQTSTEARPVHLLKLERDTEGNQTTVPVPGADFVLYNAQDPENPVQVQSTFTTDQEGRITVSLPPGRYFFQEIRLPYGFAPDLDAGNQPIRRYDFTVTTATTNDSPIVTAYNRRLSGDLIIEKTLVNDDGTELSEEQLAQLFEFRVTFSDGGTYAYQIDGNGDSHELASGETLKLRHGQRAVFTNIPVGVHYIVEEVGMEHGQANNSSGNISSDPSIVDFTNRDMTRLGNLILEKEVVNSDGSAVTNEQKEIDFEFEVQLSDVPDGASFRFTTNRYQIDDDPDNDDDTREGTVADGDTLTLRHGEILTIHDLPVGTSYQIREVEMPNFVSGTRDVEGNIVQDANNRHLFINSYQIDGGEPVLTFLSFEKQVISDDEAALKEYFDFEVTFEPDEGQTFQYRIIENGIEGELQDFVSGDIIRLRHGQKVLFADLPPGLTYRIREIEIDRFLEALTTVGGQTVSSTSNGDETGNRNGSHHTFVNREIPNGSAQLIIEKRVEGVGYDAEHEFLFDLYINDIKQDGVIRLRSGGTSLPIVLELGDRWRVVEHDSYDNGFSQEGISNGTGTIELEHIGRNVYVRQTNRYVRDTISLSGTKTWEMPEGVQTPRHITVQLMQGDIAVRQVNVEGPNWTYSFDNLPKFDNEGNEIHYTIREIPVSGWRAETNPENINLHNVWVDPVTASLEIEKLITGDAAPNAEQFEFVMNPGGHVVNITKSGQVRFPEISFDRPGTFEFTVHETRGNTLGWIYDNAEYRWFVKVEQGTDGLLSLTDQWLTKNGERIDDLIPVFTNRFDDSALLEETLDIPVNKVWDHKELTADLQPESIIVQLMADNKEVSRRELTADMEWQTLFQKMPRYDSEGREIKYRVKESEVNGYSAKISGNAQKGFIIHNTYVGMEEPPSQTPDKPSTTGRLPDVGDGLTLTVVILGLVCIRIAYLLYRETKSKGR
ncbi:Cna B-type domain-containing protein [Lactococcus formosensis]|nr:Cna B-type domain-containing protein [Lactococcus formosensis]